MVELTNLKDHLMMTNQIRYGKRNDCKDPGFGKPWIHHVLGPNSVLQLQSRMWA